MEDTVLELSPHTPKPPKAPKPDLAEVFLAEVRVVASQITVEENKVLEAINAEIKLGTRHTTHFDIPPAVAATIFLVSNGHNRDFHYWKSRELARRMTVGIWEPNSHTLGFYLDGEVGDGQHRLAAGAVAGFTFVSQPIVFALTRKATSTIDCGWRRDAAGWIKMNGIIDAKKKQLVVNQALQYIERLGHVQGHSSTEIGELIVENDKMLDLALVTGQNSIQGRAHSVLPPVMAATLAFIYLHFGAWPLDRVTESLSLLQAGESITGDKAPLYIASCIIEKAAKARTIDGRLSISTILGVAVYAMIENEKGVKATREKVILLEAKQKTPPNPLYPEKG